MTRQQEAKPAVPLTLDIGGHYPLRWLKGPRLEVDLTRATRKYFIGHLQELLRLEGMRCIDSMAAAQANKKLHFSLPDMAVGDEVYLSIHGRPVSALRFTGKDFVAGALHHEYQLALCETRALGRKLRRSDDDTRDVLRALPYDRAPRSGFNAALHAPITDVHTHSSAQIRGEDLLAAAVEAKLCYPVELLALLGVYPDGEQALHPMAGVDFNPMRDEGLKCEQAGAACEGILAGELTEKQRVAILGKMDIAPDATMGFSDFDRELYRYRNPFAKHPVLTKAILQKIAGDYQRMGIRYAELSTGSMLDPLWFREMAEAVAEIEATGGPVLRFLIGIPRNASPQRTLADIEKIKYLARHPTIVGVDLLGYESNKTSEFNWALSHIAQWAKVSEGESSDLKIADGWDFKRDFIIRVHAGETAKNQDNVPDAIRIAAEHGVRLRIGHGLHAAMSREDEHDLATLVRNPDHFASERCMDSNQMYRTQMLVHKQPAFLKVGRKFAPRFLGTDGSGAIGTSPVQLAYSALAAGWSIRDLEELRVFEEGYIARQAEREAIKSAAFAKLYKGGLTGFLTGYQREVMDKIPKETRAPTPPGSTELLHYLPQQFAGKMPLLIGGASGSSWEEMDKLDRDEVRRAMHLLVQCCDPKKVYFVLGRVQRAGVSKALDLAVKQWNGAHPEQKFAMLGRFAGATKQPTSDLADTVDWVQDIPQGRDYVPASMLNFIAQHKGRAIFFNGSDFTAEMAYGAPERRIPHAIHEPLKGGGKMGEVAQTAETDSQFRDLDGFVEQVLQRVGQERFFLSEYDKRDVLREGLDIAALAAQVKNMKFADEKPRLRKRVI